MKNGIKGGSFNYVETAEEVISLVQLEGELKIGNIFQGVDCQEEGRFGT